MEGGENSYDYADLATLQVDGDLRRIWVLADLVHADKEGDMSYRNHLEYDCTQGRYRALQTVYYAGAMATGRMTGRIAAATQWRAVAPGTISASVMRLVCAQR